MGDERIEAVLSRSRLFGSLTGSDLSNLASECTLRRVRKGSTLFHRGDEGDTLYVVAAGSLAMTAVNEMGRESVLEVFGPRESFGEIAVLDQGPRLATAVAREDSVVVAVPGSAVRDLSQTHAGVSRALLDTVLAIARQVHGRSLDLVGLSLRGRVAKALVSFAARSGVDPETEGMLVVNIVLNQSELARNVGGSRQRVNEVLSDLESEGAIARAGRKLIGIRPADLQRVVAESAK